ncbi:MAG: outer membrane protein assembly factor BamE [Alphaproteobacteria bacterium]|nr:outer membrane protein assembly factor BamE [Alphaproteobacteria bacterium]MDE2492704.1 outer membrane protein assembly factor BamE [Alphaproteobacteria bacterium]
MKKLALSALSLMLLTGCTPVISQRGYLPDPDAEAGIIVGKDNKTTIEAKLGDPSLQATFGNDAWYYVSSVEKQIAFFTPTIESRHILAVYFNKDGKVVDMKHYSLADGHVVAFETRTTPSRGRELTFLQQLFNATPGVAGTQNEREQNPGGGGGPPGS